MLRPVFNRVLITFPPREEKTKSGLYIPQTAPAEKSVIGTVSAIGPEVSESLNLKVGDRVVFDKYGGIDVKMDDGTEARLILDTDITAIVE